MANGTIHKLGTLKVNGTVYAKPSNPVNGGDCVSYNGTAISIENTQAGKELQWIEWTKPDGTKMLVCDRCLVVNITWNNLNSAGLIFGKEITIDGQKYKVRSLTGSTGASGTYGTGCNNEWDQFLDAVGERNDLVHWQNMYTWCQDTYYSNSSYRSLRGSSSARDYTGIGYAYASNYPFIVGWRPALEILNAAPQISPANKSYGEIATPPSLTVTVTDSDGDAYTGKILLDGTQKATFSGTGTGTHVVPISDWWGALSLGSHTVTVQATDSNNSTSTNTYTFSKTNSAPVAPRVTNLTNGNRMPNNFYVEFEVGTDADGDTQELRVQTADDAAFSKNKTEFSEMEKYVDEEWVSVTSVSNQDVGSKFRIQVKDQTTGKVRYIRVVTRDSGTKSDVSSPSLYVRIGNVLEISTLPVDREVRPSVVNVKVKSIIGQKATVEMWVTCNANDEKPTWEKCTLGSPHSFKNDKKTADKWGVAVKIKVTANDEAGEISISAVGLGVL